MKSSVQLMTESGIKVLQAALPSSVAGGDSKVVVAEYEEVHPSLILPPYLPSPEAIRSKVQVTSHDTRAMVPFPTMAIQSVTGRRF